jgi:hypothetical protein
MILANTFEQQNANNTQKKELLANPATRPAGLEPATFGFEVRDSIQLSYGRIKFSDI